MQNHMTTACSTATRRLGPVRSPVVFAAISRRSQQAKAFWALKRALISTTFSLILLTDWYFSLSMCLLSGIVFTVLQYAEVALLTVLLLGCLHDVTLYVSTHLMLARIRLTPSQSKVLCINSSASGYELVSDPVPFGESVTATPTSFHTPSPHRHMYSSPASSSYSSWHSTPHTSFTGLTPTSTRIYRTSSPFGGEPVSDARSLERYLQQEEKKEQRLLRGSLDPFSSPQTSPTDGSGLYRGHLCTNTPSPRKYHVAPRSSSPSSRRGDFDSPQYGSADKSLDSCGIKKSDLDNWTERCRKWISVTILKPLANEINTINSTLSRKGMAEQIGLVSLDILKRMHSSSTLTLPLVIQYLDLSTKQDYLVERIKELARGSYLSAYCWDSGGKWKGRAWSIDLPNDSQIVMHVLSTYLDSHLPPDPWFPNGKTFSTQYFLKTLPKNGSKQQSVCIVQSTATPPIYKVLIKGKYVNVPEGRNNLFHSFCIFLYHVKKDEESMLGTINLETAGIKVLSIISSSH